MLPEMWACIVAWPLLGLDEMRALAVAHTFFHGIVNEACESYYQTRLLKPLIARVDARLVYSSDLIDWEGHHAGARWRRRRAAVRVRAGTGGGARALR
jgi:hypothetical protein